MQILDNRKQNLTVCGATAPGRAESARGPAVRRWGPWITLALLAISLVATPVAAQDDCDRIRDWNDIEWYRSCLEQQGRGEDWATEVLLFGARWFDNPAIVQFLLQAGANPQAVNNEGLTPLHGGVSEQEPGSDRTSSGCWSGSERPGQ